VLEDKKKGRAQVALIGYARWWCTASVREGMGDIECQEAAHPPRRGAHKEVVGGRFFSGAAGRKGGTRLGTIRTTAGNDV